MLKTLFLPVGLLVAVAAAWLIPAPGLLLRAHAGVQILVITIFVINGWTMTWEREHVNGRFVIALSAACALSLVGGPWLGIWGSRSLFGLAGEGGVGLMVMASVPVTLSSAIVISAVAGGNHIWALLMTMGMNLLGIFTVPIMLKVCLPGGDVPPIAASALLGKLALLVLAPFAVGHLSRRLLSGRMHPVLAYVPSLCVILTVYAAFAASRSGLLAVEPALFLHVLCAALVIHLSLLGLAYLLARVLRQTSDERKAFCFVSSQKSLPIAVSVLASLGMDTALTLLPCLVFHFSQLILDSSIAAHWARYQRDSGHT